MRRFEFQEGGSCKFWEIEQNESAFTVRYGRIGSDGQSKTTTCANAAQAAAEVAKLIREKTKKGYQEIALGGAPVVQTVRRLPRYDHHEHVAHFAGYAVTELNGGDEDSDDAEGGGGLRDVERRAFAIRGNYDTDEDELASSFDALLADPKVSKLKALIIGQWFSDVCEEGPDAVIAKLIAAKDRLTSLRALFIGDVTPEECEISWLHQSDLAPLLHALPQLEELVVRGGNGLRFTNLKHAGLRTLIVQTGGLPAVCVRDLMASDLPNLERVGLWFGSDNYGGDAKVEDLAPLLAGKIWPRLDCLGLQNSEFTDAIATSIAAAPILDRIRALDLSMGTLSDAGGQALLDSPAIKRLTVLNLRRHYLSPEMCAKLKALGPDVDVSDREEAESYSGETYYSCEVSE